MSQSLSDVDCCNSSLFESRTVGPVDRRAFAKRKLSKGTVILRNLPLAWVAHDRSNCCAYCGIPKSDLPKSLLRCSRCQKIWYCSRDCQKLDFSVHKVECKERYLLRDEPTGNASLLVRNFLTLQKLPARCTMKTSERGMKGCSCGKQHFDNLVASPSPLPPDEREQVEMATKALWNHSKLLGRDADDSECRYRSISDLRSQLEEYCRIFRANNFGVTNSMVKVVASGVYPLGALLNHSCAPNCVLHYHWGREGRNRTPSLREGPILEIVAGQDIDVGDELTHSYVELVALTTTRQQRLLAIHGFECTCKRCQGLVSASLPAYPSGISLEEKSRIVLQQYIQGLSDTVVKPTTEIELDTFLKPHINDNDQWMLAQQFHQQARVAMTQGDLEQEVLSLQRSVELMIAASDEGFSLDLYQVRGDRLCTLLVVGQTEAALVECEYLVAFLLVALHHVACHPLLGLQLFTLGDLYDAVGDKRKALAVYQWAEMALKVSHGNESGMMQVLREKLEVLYRSMS